MSQAGQELRTVLMVAKRELLRVLRNPVRALTGFIQPLLYLFVLGNGLGSIVQAGSGGGDYKTYLFPGVVAMNILSSAIFSGVSIVWDREFGFLREMLVAPVSRTSILMGKIIGGSTVATAQGCLMLALAPTVGVHLTLLSVLGFIGGALLMAFSLTSLGVFIAGRMKRMESFQIVMQMLLLPMIFLSGVMFPLRGLPVWLTVLTRLNPISYAVDPLRRILLGNAPILEALHSGITLFGRVLPVWGELTVMGGFAVLFVGMAMATFGRPE